MKKRLLFGALALATIGFTASSCSSDSEDTGTNSPITNNPDNGNGNGGGNTGSTTAKYEHKTLIEDYTGAWCGWCPRVSHSIELVKAHATLGDKIIPVAIHTSDVMQISASNAIRNLFGVNSFPTAYVNRTAKWNSPENNNLAQIYNSINQQGSSIGIKIASNLTNAGGTVTATFRFSEGYENLKYHIFVLENGVIRTDDPQENYTTFYGGDDQLPNFVHNDVLMAVSGTATGNSLGTVTPGQEVIKDNQGVTFSLNNNDLTKVEVVVFVTDSTGKKVLNAQSAHANETKDFVIISQ